MLFITKLARELQYIHQKITSAAVCGWQDQSFFLTKQFEAFYLKKFYTGYYSAKFIWQLVLKTSNIRILN